uniref:Uncharacterized protein n=1 Tax=Strigamia maritima TaxID=126957 RepID=T1J4C5_STRMM
MLCRVGAKELSDAVKPSLDAHNIRLIGVGVEEFGLQGFLEGNYFAGEMYVDTKKECYRRLGYKRYNMLSILPALFTGRADISKARETGIGGDFKGDGLQNGGVLIVAAGMSGGEKTLFSWAQPSVTDHLDPKKILE